MVADNEATLFATWKELRIASFIAYMGAFNCTSIPIGVKGCLIEMSLFLEVEQRGTLHIVLVE